MSLMPTFFRWRGEPIPDIRAWARDRGERMVRVRFTPGPKADPLTGQLIKPEPYEQEMPETFWKCMMIPSDVKAQELARFEPNAG